MLWRLQVASWHYNTALFQKETVERIAAQFNTLLQARTGAALSSAACTGVTRSRRA